MQHGLSKDALRLLVKRMTVYAASKIPRHQWRGEASGQPPGAEEALDLVQDAFRCALDRSCEWSTAGGYDMEALNRIMRNRIDRRLRHLARSHENRNIRLESLIEANPNATELATNDFSEERVLQHQILQRAHKRLRTDPEGRLAFDDMVEGTIGPKALAKSLNVSIAAAANTTKRVRRKMSIEFSDLIDEFNLRRPSKGGREPDEE